MSTAPPTTPGRPRGPGKIRSPSPGWRLIPQTKQSGKTGSVKYRARPAAARASASETAPGISGARPSGEERGLADQRAAVEDAD